MIEKLGHFEQKAENDLRQDSRDNRVTNDEVDDQEILEKSKGYKDFRFRVDSKRQCEQLITKFYHLIENRKENLIFLKQKTVLDECKGQKNLRSGSRINTSIGKKSQLMAENHF